MGFTWHSSYLKPGKLLPYLFTLTLSEEFSKKTLSLKAVYFCGTSLGVTSTGCYPASYPVELGLSSS